MISLPPLSAGDRVWRLPLTGRAAIRLANVLLEDDVAKPSEKLVRLLGDEPALLLWCICRATDYRQSPPGDLPSVAGWFSAHALSELEWCDEPRSGVRNCNSNAATSAPATSVSQDLWPLLRRARQLLSSCGPTVALENESAESSCLPEWLWANLRREPELPVEHSLAVSPDADDLPVIDLSGLVGRLARLRELETNLKTAVEQEKLAALKELAYGASHEINNPLANISTRAQSLLRDERDPERRRKLATINSQAFRAHEMIADMMMFAKPPPLRLAATDVTAIVDLVVAELAREAEEQGTLLRRTSADTPAIIVADAEQLAVVLKAMCANSLQALGAGGRIDVAALIPATSTTLEISVRDTGPGITAQVRRNLFDPFYSGREAGRGLGFGLSKCWRIVTAHGGSIDVDSEPGRGATFTIHLPVAAAEMHARSA